MFSLPVHVNVSSSVQAREINSGVKPVPSAVTEVTVMISDVNDETPTFKNSFYECEIAENSPLNTPVVFLRNVTPEVYDYDQVSDGVSNRYPTPFRSTYFKISKS